MKARQFLESYGELLTRAGRLERECELCRRYAKENPKNLRWAVRAEDLAREMRKACHTLETRRREIECKLAFLSHQAGATVLAMRYLRGYTYEEIAEVTNYSPRHVQRLHVQAVERLEPFMDTEPCPKRQSR